MNTDTESTNLVQSRWAIVIIDFNGLDDTRKCLESLKKLAGGPPKVVVIDNGSSPPTHEAIREFADWVDVIRSEKNGGWAGGNNVGIAKVLDQGFDFILLLNNDTTVDPQLLDRLTAAADRHPEYGVFSPIVCYMDQPDEVNADGCYLLDPAKGFFARHEITQSQGVDVAEDALGENAPVENAPAKMVETELVNGCCFAVRAEVFRKAGTIDERFFLIHEESEFCLRAQEAGFRCGIVPEKLVLHKGSSSFQRESKPWQRYFDTRNLYMLLRKHRAKREAMPMVGTWCKYLKHVYYMYCLQMDRENPEAADAVLAGFVDGLAGRHGPWQDRTRPLAKWIGRVFEWRRGSSQRKQRKA